MPSVASVVGLLAVIPAAVLAAPGGKGKDKPFDLADLSQREVGARNTLVSANRRRSVHRGTCMLN